MELLWCQENKRQQMQLWEFKIYANFFDPPPGRERGSLQECLKDKFFHPPHLPCGYKTLFSINHLNLKQFKNNTLQDTGQDRYNRYGPVHNRYTINQSTPHFLSVYWDHSMQGGGKKEDFFPHTQLGTESKGVKGKWVPNHS